MGGKEKKKKGKMTELKVKILAEAVFVVGGNISSRRRKTRLKPTWSRTKGVVCGQSLPKKTDRRLGLVGGGFKNTPNRGKIKRTKERGYRNK